MVFLTNLKVFLSYVIRPELILLVGTMLYFIYNHHRRMWSLGVRMFLTDVIPSPKKELKRSMSLGLLGGIIASVLFLLLGISVPSIGLNYLWFISMVLLLFQPRFICFAYSGGIVGLGALVSGVSVNEVSSLVALVAILHLVEAVLIRVGGADSSLPMYIKQSDGRVVGGYSLQRYWPIPFIALLTHSFTLSADETMALTQANWWPLWPCPDFNPSNVIIFFPLLVMAILGYSDFTVSSSPKQKAQMSSNYLFGYSLTLLTLALLANYHIAFAYLAVLFSPAGHEWVIQKGRKREKRSTPVFTRDNGVMVMAVVPGSVAGNIGLQVGDIILEFNGEAINTSEDLNTAMSPWALDVEMQVENIFTGQRRNLSYHGKVPPLGIILAPRPDEKMYVTFAKSGWFNRVLQRKEKHIKA